jgi:hypothetical protein
VNLVWEYLTALVIKNKDNPIKKPSFLYILPGFAYQSIGQENKVGYPNGTKRDKEQFLSI